jgi:long-chain fatty acid transport protein
MPHLTLSRLATALALAGVGSLSHAAGFALIEQNASGLGNAYAGQAAVAADASTVFFNPAGMSLLPDAQLVVAGHLIKPSAEFSGTFSTPVGGGQGGDAGGLAFVPNLYFAFPLTPDVHLGVGINAPFGLKTEYDSTWIGRFQAVESEIETINLNPSIAFKLNDQVSIGAGLSLQRIEATLTNNLTPLVPASFGKISGDDYGWGYNLGILWQPSQATRVGLAYRSEVEYTLEGTFTSNFAAVPSGDVTAKATMPASASLSLFHKLSSSLDILADVTWTGWSSFDELRVLRTNGALLSLTPENWSDSWRYSLGATWHMDPAWSWRVGVAYDETPVSDAFRTARIPDESRTWLALGGQYRMGKQNVIDFGYAHLFVEDASINVTTAAGTLVGKYDNHVDILSAQFTRQF